MFHALSSPAAIGCLLLSVAAAVKAQECQQPLDEETLQSLVLWGPFSPSVLPGGEAGFTLGVIECCVFVRRIPACAVWSIEPPDAGTLEVLPVGEGDPGGPSPPSAVLTVSIDAPHGTIITITADVESGRRLLEAQVTVYTREANPLVGAWRQAAALDCPAFIRADLDESGEPEITDAIQIFNFLFLGGDRPGCLETADANDDEETNITDGIYILNFQGPLGIGKEVEVEWVEKALLGHAHRCLP